MHRKIWLRHFPSEANVKGQGEYDSPLHKQENRDLSALYARLFFGDVNIRVGSLKRHKGTIENIMDYTGQEIEFETDDRLNAYVNSPLTNTSGKETEEMYDLEQFKNFFYEGLSARELGIFPFDPLFSMAYLNKDLHENVFGNDAFVDFGAIERSVISLQNDLIEREGHELLISSSSAVLMHAEHKQFGTVGRNTHKLIHLFPQEHNEVMLMHAGKYDLHLIGQNINMSELHQYTHE